MADTDPWARPGCAFLEGLAAAPEQERRVRVPTITDPRGIDFAVYRRLGQSEWMAALERRAIAALRAFGVLMTDTCINYQTIMAPVRGDHLAYGDTGVVIYSNSVLGARSNFEGGPSALAAALTGRTPRYGYHLDECRRGTRRFRLTAAPRDLSEWGAHRRHRRRGLRLVLAGAGGRGHRRDPRLRCLEAFRHGLGELRLGRVVPNAGDHRRGGRLRRPAARGGRRSAMPRSTPSSPAMPAPGDKLDVVVFGAPQLSLFEMAALADAWTAAASTPTPRSWSPPRRRSSTPPTAWA